MADPLTGLTNRRRLELFGEKFLAISKRNGQLFQVAMIDRDHFKEYNDERGRLKGDNLLVSLAGIIKDGIRKSDLFARYGGDGFTHILNNVADQQYAVKKAGRTHAKSRGRFGGLHQRRHGRQ